MSVTISGDGTITGTTGFLYAGTRYYTSSGTFAKADPLGTGDIGLRAIRVRMVGAGGGGGGAGTTGSNEGAVASGGGGGAYAESFITDIAGLAASVTVTRGAGGAGGAAGANNGSAGGSSSFGTAVVAQGGSAGFGRSATTYVIGNFQQFGAAGGYIGNVGDMTIAGGASAASYQFGAVSGGLVTTFLGGGTFFQPMRPFQLRGVPGIDGEDGGSSFNGPGTGGGGGANLENQATARAGGPGGNGIVIVDCYV